MKTFKCAALSSAVITLVICSGPVRSFSQNNRIEAHLNAAYKGRLLLLRYFFNGEKLAYDKDGTIQGKQITYGSWTLAGIEIAHIKSAASGVEIVGDRVGVSFTGERRNYTKIRKIRISVMKTISAGDPETSLDAVFDKIFISPEKEDFKALVPAYWQSYLTGNDYASRNAAWKAIIDKTNIQVFDPHKSSLTKPPREIASPWASATKEALENHVGGTCVLGIVIDTTGDPVDVAIVRPLGMGLDDEAARTVQQWRFHPATSDGKPVAAKIMVDVAFPVTPTSPF